MESPDTSRRRFLKGALGLALWGLLPSRLSPAASAAPLPPLAAPPMAGAPLGALPLGDMVGERLTFDIGFWIFSRAGHVVVELAPLPGQRGLYEATMTGQTAGVIGFFTRYRKDVYRSVMELAGGRLRPLQFQEEVIIGEEVRRRRIIYFNYQAGVMTRRKLVKGSQMESDELAMAPGKVYDDYLSGLYNLRSGAYGALREGRSYTLHVPRPKGETIRLEVSGPEETRRLLQQDSRLEGKTFYCRIFMDKDALNSSTGRLEGWFSAQAVPLGGVVEDVALFGDITGRLASREMARPSVTNDV